MTHLDQVELLDLFRRSGWIRPQALSNVTIQALPLPVVVMHPLAVPVGVSCTATRFSVEAIFLAKVAEP